MSTDESFSNTDTVLQNENVCSFNSRDSLDSLNSCNPSLSSIHFHSSINSLIQVGRLFTQFKQFVQQNSLQLMRFVQLAQFSILSNPACYSLHSSHPLHSSLSFKSSQVTHARSACAVQCATSYCARVVEPFQLGPPRLRPTSIQLNPFSRVAD